MFATWFQSDALLLHHWELCWLTNEHLEGVIFLLKSAKGHRVGVQIKGQSESIPEPFLGLH